MPCRRKWLGFLPTNSADEPSFFTGHQAWRFEDLLELQAYCRYKAGQLAEAEREFTRLIKRWEKIPNSIEQIHGWLTVEVVCDCRLSESLYQLALRFFKSTDYNCFVEEMQRRSIAKT